MSLSPFLEQTCVRTGNYVNAAGTSPAAYFCSLQQYKLLCRVVISLELPLHVVEGCRCRHTQLADQEWWAPHFCKS